MRIIEVQHLTAGVQDLRCCVFSVFVWSLTINHSITHQHLTLIHFQLLLLLTYREFTRPQLEFITLPHHILLSLQFLTAFQSLL